MKYLTNLDLNKNELQNAVVQNLSSAPSNPKAGQHYFNTTDHKEYVYDGTNWVDALSQGNYTFQNGVEVVSGTRNVQVKLATGANAGNVSFTANSDGLAASVAEASTSAKGIIEIADDTEAATGTSETLAVNPKQLATKVTANAAITAETTGKCKITYDAKGLVTGGADLVASDIPALDSAKVTTLGSYEKASASAAIATTDSLNAALGKLEYKADAAVVANTAITGATKTKITYDSKGLVTAGADLAESDIPSLHLAKVTDVTATAAEVNVLHGMTADTAELNILDGATLTTTELNYVDGVTSSIQTQLDNKVAKNADITAGTGTVVTYDAKGLVTGSSELAIKSTSTNYLEYDSANHEFGAKVDTVVTADSTNLVTSGAVKSAINAAVTGGVHYAGTWDITSATDFSGISLPQTKGALFYVTGTGPKTVGGIEWNAGDYLLFNDDVASGGTVTGKVDKIDNTESSDLVRLTATQTLTSKTIDADNNTISNLETDNFKSGVVVTSVRASSSALDTALASEKAVRTELDTKQNLVAPAIANDIAFLNDDGQVIDSGKAVVTTLGPASGEGAATDNQLATAAATRAAINDAAGAAAHKKVKDLADADVQFDDGQVVWTFANPFADADVIVQVKQSDNEVVIADVDADTSTIRITFNADEEPAANAFKAVIIG